MRKGGLLREGRTKICSRVLRFTSMPPMPGNPQNAEAHCHPTLQCLIVHKVVGFRMSSLCSPWWIHRNHCGSQETKTAEVLIVNMQGRWVRGGCATSRMPPPRLSPLECWLDQEEGEGTQRRNLSNKICVSCTANAALYCCYVFEFVAVPN